ncbi:hypothetical protein NLX71_24585 [Paenibacillus sp. MZ04-78.2]|uniref:hypothetical protein n=1 Tax=Paenibacillus sp. MZ04-78.2 TaxID=2962034 RepID=UPI0020B71DCD|nr:hypothetical protein [Paenibacillus sp. MZ04-78.2]MCP3776427.1 hypothetical protein [Paenibacillus sp. MZ04-78.2]
MILTNEQLKRIIEGKPVGDYYPYNMKEYDSKPIDDYLSKVIGSLNQINSLEFESIFDHYGSGFASYVDVFCWKKDGSSSSDLRGVLWRNGIRIYICRLAPIAVLGKGQSSKHATGGSRDFLNVDIIDSLPNGDWARVSVKYSPPFKNLKLMRK